MFTGSILAFTAQKSSFIGILFLFGNICMNFASQSLIKG